MLNDVKKMLGISNTNFDSILNSYIESAKMDLRLAGILEYKIVETDALIKSAIISYVLSMFDTYEFRELSFNAYNMQKDQLRHYAEYTNEMM